jgi:hypothetical protein
MISDSLKLNIATSIVSHIDMILRKNNIIASDLYRQELTNRYVEEFKSPKIDPNQLRDNIISLSDDAIIEYFNNYKSENPLNEESGTKSDDEFLTALNSQMTNALFKDSENRADIVLDFLLEKGDDLMASFGVEATDLIFEIVGGLKQDEEQRLGKPKTKSAPVQEVEQTDEEAIDELDFLDDDIDKVFNLKEIEEELDLDDFKLD